MDLDVSIDKESLSINIENPHRFDTAQVTGQIVDFGEKLGVDLALLEIEKLVPRMIRGVAGCEGGCPADAKSLVREGFGDFDISYVEGGILTAQQSLGNGIAIVVKIFPDFQ